MPHNKNTDKVVKRLLPWIILLGFLGLVVYTYLPTLSVPYVDNSSPAQPDLASEVAVRDDPAYNDLNSLKEQLYHHFTPEQSHQEKLILFDESINNDPSSTDASQSTKSSQSTDRNLENDEPEEPFIQSPIRAASKDTTTVQVDNFDHDPLNSLTPQNASHANDERSTNVNTNNKSDIISNTSTNTSANTKAQNDSAQRQDKTRIQSDNDTTPQSTSSQRSGEFVKQLAVYENQTHFWQYIADHQPNQTLIEQLKPLQKLLSRNSLIRVEILYTDYVKEETVNPENSKIIAVRGTEKNKTWIYFTRFDKDGIYYYDYDGNAPEPSMDRVPLNYTRITSPFNPKRRHPISGRIRPHDGVDLKAPYGAPVHSTGDGIVSFAGWQHGYGRLVIVKHPNNYETRYAHLSAIEVTVGDNIKRGTVIGKLGNSGISTGHHLHFEVRVDGVPKDPMTVALPSFKPFSHDYMDIWHFRAEQYQTAMKELTKTGYTLN